MAAQRKVTLHVASLNVTDQHSVNAAVQAVVAECGTLDGVINNATLLLRGYFEDFSDAEFRRVLEVNLFGTAAVARAVLPYMRTARRGRIIVITSVAGRLGSPSGSAYSASRFAQEGFVESLSQEMTPLGVHVIAVEPGITNTDAWTVDWGAAARANDPQSPYSAWFRRAEQLFDQAMHSSGLTPAATAAVVHAALIARRPRLRYVVGRRAALVLALRRYTPGDLFDRIYFAAVVRRVTQGQSLGTAKLPAATLGRTAGLSVGHQSMPDNSPARQDHAAS
jgi:NAD(P)-dependent dehydrogenase (short-subunit alcohol dehydrogenase family)